MTGLDYLVLTASSAAQARGYHAQLADRQRRGALPGIDRWLVIPDARDRRIGSGGSTLNVLFELARRLAARRPAASLAELFGPARILVIHSGGDSRRLPAYAAQGKIFTPLPRRVGPGRPADLFDLVLEDLLSLLPAGAARTVLAAGDLLLGLAASPPDLDGPGVTGVAFPGSLEQAARHGVYIADAAGTVTDFLQKPGAREAHDRGAVDVTGRALIDTGVVALDPPAVERFLSTAGVRFAAGPARARVTAGTGLLADIRRGRAAPIDLYQHILMALAPRLGRDQYLASVSGTSASEAERRSGACLYDGLHGLPFNVRVMPFCQFLHVGTSREFLSLVTTDPRLRDRPPAWLTVYNSRARLPRSVPRPVVMEACELSTPLRFGGDNILTGLPATRGVPSLPPATGLVALPVGAKHWAAIVYGLDDDAKTALESDGTFLNRPLRDFLGSARLTIGEVWPSTAPGESRTLWNARLFRTGPLILVLRDARWLLRGRGPAPAAWRRGPRRSLAELLPAVDHQRLISHRRECQRRERFARAAEELLADPWLPAEDIAAEGRDRREADEAIRGIEAAARTAAPLSQARLFRAAAMIRERFPARARTTPRRLNRAAFAAVARAVSSELPLPARARPARIQPDQVVWVTTPVRIDLAGGWTDTPPVCHELGGAVVNAAITLNGQYPVQVMARLSERPAIRLTSVDLGRSVSFMSSAQLCDASDPRDWASLAKAALVLSGIAPASPREPLARRLGQLGGGIDLTTFSALPKGSGLGTSSILGAAILAAIDRLQGDDIDHATLIRRTSLLEQMMSTAGGWQDQAGGITPGLKLLRTEPGPDQLPAVDPLPPVGPGHPLAARTLLYYTGQRRLARDILQNVVARYLARDRRLLRTIHRIKAGALEAAAALRAGDAEAFVRSVAGYWELKQSLDPGATNPGIEAIINAVKPDLAAAELPGAGGGGFIVMIARDDRAAARIRDRLTRRPPNSLARFYEFAVDTKGLSVAAL